MSKMNVKRTLESSKEHLDEFFLRILRDNTPDKKEENSPLPPPPAFIPKPVVEWVVDTEEDK